MTPPFHEDHFWAKVQVTGACWLWTAGVSSTGYGRMRINNVLWYAHRWSYTTLVGPIPAGLELDHLCRVITCVNPDHLEPVDGATNKRRGYGAGGVNLRKTHCKRGHEFTIENTELWRGHRKCRICIRETDRRRRERRALRRAAVRSTEMAGAA